MNEAPFIFGKMAMEDDFTGRANEIQHLEINFNSLINTIIISPRRWGKSSLVHLVADKMTKKDASIKICQIDLFDVRTEEEFFNLLATELLKATASKWEEIAENAKAFLSRFIPRITFSPNQESEISFGLEWNELKKHPNEILDLAETIAAVKNIKIVICIDEFQNIANFEDPLAFQKKLRSRWQRHSHAAYCLYGSKRHMMLDVFTNAKMPFYKFGDTLFLEKISTEEWGAFIQKRFKDTHKEISKEDAVQIALLVDNHSYYVQQLAQQVWLRTARKCQKGMVNDAHERLTYQLSLQFLNITETLATTQVNFLKAVLCNEIELHSQTVLLKFKLGTSGNVTRIKQALMDREIIDVVNHKIIFQDPMYRYWLQRDYFRLKR